jgi:hypothetical protein
MKSLSLHCLNTEHPEATIKTLMAAKTFAKQIIVGDLSSSDNLKYFCTNNKIQYFKLSLGSDLSQCHNDLVSRSDMKWHMHLYSGETLNNTAKVQEVIQGSPAVYRLPVIQGGWLNKEVRLYNRDLYHKFTNPVFESINTPSQFLEVYVTGADTSIFSQIEKMLEIWTVRQPLSSEPRYYTALNLLMEGKQAEFINAAKNHLFKDQTVTVQNTMLRYYLACGLAGKIQTRQEAAKHVVTCLAASVLMAEFWCLLGDMCLAEGGYERAKAMYRNAITLGNRRHKDDMWPMHIVKYKEHPTKMIAACDKAIQESITFKVGGSRGSATSEKTSNSST